MPFEWTVAEAFPDLEPLPQDDGPDPVVQIAYSAEFVATMDIFRRVLAIGEFSERTLRLSAEVIELNAANYTAWQYRRKCLDELHAAAEPEARRDAWKRELEFCTEAVRQNMKNYQVWFHRRSCVERVGDATGELAFVAEVLAEDAKNYHAWGHRQWVLKHFSLWAGELEYIDTLLAQDVRNNSAWNQRYYVLKHTADLTSHDVVGSELAYALRHIEGEPDNPSPWAYLKGVVEPVGYEHFPQLRRAAERLGSPPYGDGGTAQCAQALGILVEILSRKGADDAEKQQAAELCDTLAALDAIRVAYWNWRKTQVLDPLY